LRAGQFIPSGTRISFTTSCFADIQIHDRHDPSKFINATVLLLVSAQPTGSPLNLCAFELLRIGMVPSQPVLLDGIQPEMSHPPTL
ncbi:unnamed protein product, partial [Amoebophrya sp. A25]